MSAIHLTKQGEMVDLVCHRHYGRTREVTEIVLSANPGLAGFGPVLPIGTRIVLPDVSAHIRRASLTSLWD